MRLLALAAAVLLMAAAPPTALLQSALAAYARGDYAAARRSFITLADADSAIAETMLGTIFARGQGVRADPAAAAGYYYRAAQRGYPPAQLAFARARLTGSGIAPDPDEALIWARRAAERGDPRVTRAAMALAAQLTPGHSAADLAALDRRRLAWQPWPTGRD